MPRKRPSPPRGFEQPMTAGGDARAIRPRGRDFAWRTASAGTSSTGAAARHAAPRPRARARHADHVDRSQQDLPVALARDVEIRTPWALRFSQALGREAGRSRLKRRHVSRIVPAPRAPPSCSCDGRSPGCGPSDEPHVSAYETHSARPADRKTGEFPAARRGRHSSEFDRRGLEHALADIRTPMAAPLRSRRRQSSLRRRCTPPFRRPHSIGY